jgi:tRNA 2-thiouridine synthesizing protein D
MHIGALILSSPVDGACHGNALDFVRCALNHGHSVPQVFFSDAATLVSLRGLQSAPGQPDLQAEWLALANSHPLELVVCSTSARLRGVLDAAEAQREGLPGTSLHPGFLLGGLGTLVQASSGADRMVTFGG